MKRIILILTLILISSFFSFSQKIEDVGAGVIDFLLRNPKTANKMNATETIALDIIGDLLKTQSERKHQLAYASAGSNQITINSNDGRQAQFVKNENGKVFLLVDGVIYPIAQELIDEAENPTLKSENRTISYLNSTFDYEAELKKFFASESYKIVYYKEPYTVIRGGEYLYEIVNKTGGFKDYIGDENYHELSKKYIDNREKIPANTKLTIVLGYPHTVIYPIFGFKWVQDLNGNNSYEFDEFNQKKRVFYDNENFYIAVFALAGKYSEGELNVQLYNNYTGALLKSDSRYIGKDRFEYFFFQINSNELRVGTYKINATLNNITDKCKTSRNEIIEIIKGNSDTRELTEIEKMVIEQEKSEKGRITTSTPKGIFFYNSWEDKNSNNKYDYAEFTGLNKASYNLKKEKMHIGINFPNKSGEIILQSYTKEKKLLGTTTNNYQRVSGGHWAGLGGEPYEDMDFIDMVQINGVGEYIISISFVEGGTFEQKLVIKE